MDGLERRLVELRAYLDYPATPPLAMTVRARLAATPSRPRVRRWRLIAAAVAAALAIAFGIPPVRTAIAHWLGITGIVIRPVRSLPATTPPTTPQSLQQLGLRLGLGRLSSLEAARAVVGFAVAVPASLSAPDGVYVRNDLGPVVSLLYRPSGDLSESQQTGVGLLITEFRGSADPQLVQKLVVPGTQVLPVTIGGGQGYWIPSIHGLEYRLPDGSIRPDEVRLSGPTLIFERGDVSVRIEGAVSEERALSIAAGLR